MQNRLKRLEARIGLGGKIHIALQDFQQPDLFFFEGDKLTIETIRAKIPERDVLVVIEVIDDKEKPGDE